MLVSRRWLLWLLPVFLTACGTVTPPRDGVAPDVTRDGAPSQAQKIDIASIPDAVPRAEPRSKYGNPETYVVANKTYRTLSASEGYLESGIASWYGTKFHGRRTSSGEPYDMHGMTAAHKILPLPTYAEITNLQNGRKVTVKINDRGPFHENRLIDLSYAAASKLGILATGTGLVEVRAITPGTAMTDAPALGAAVVAAERVSLPLGQRSRVAKLYLQVGAFSNRDNAERLRIRLAAVPVHPCTHRTGASCPADEAASSNARIIERPAAGDSLYRVRLGPFASVEEMDRFASKLSGLGIRDTQAIID